MKRAIVIGLIVALSMSSAALAGTRSFSGSFKGGGTISFKAHVQNGTPTKITGLKWKHLPIDCSSGDSGGGTVAYNGGFNFGVTVARRHFETRGQTPDGSVRSKFEGHFVKHGKQATGYLKVDGSFPPEFQDCHSGKAQFKVK